MTTIEQILLKLGIDQSQVGPGLSDFKSKVAEATNHGSKSFLHVESASRAFHRALHEITSASPLLGTALRLALNPVVGLIMGGVMAFQQFRDAQKEAAAEAKEEAKKVREAWVEAQEAIYSKDPNKAFAGKVKEAAATNVREGHDASAETIQGQYAKTPVAGYYYRLQRWLAEKLGYHGYEAGEEEIQRMREGVGRGTLTGALSRSRNKEEDDEHFKEAVKNAKEIDKLYSEAYRNEDEAEGKVLTHEEAINAALADRNELFAVMADERTSDLDKAKSALEISKLDKTIATERKQLAHEKAEAEKKVANELARGSALAERVHFQQGMTKQGQFASYQPTIDELAHYGGRTPWARQARYVEWLEAGAHNQVLRGDVAGAKETIFGKGGVRELCEQLENAGLIKPEISLEKMQEHLAKLAQAAISDGIVISPESLD
jgi:hypothetical protein